MGGSVCFTHSSSLRSLDFRPLSSPTTPDFTYSPCRAYSWLKTCGGVLKLQREMGNKWISLVLTEKNTELIPSKQIYK